MWGGEFLKNGKKIFVFLNENGYVWIGFDSINLDVIKRWRCIEMWNLYLVIFEVLRISWVYEWCIFIFDFWLVNEISYK